jgi:hypothetical protein
VLDLFATDGGIVRIDEELIYFEDFDDHEGKFTGCLRGVFGTEARSHEYGAKVLPIWAYPSTRLLENVNEDGAYFKLENLGDFPDAGYLRIADADEVIGYTRHDVRQSGGASRASSALLQPLRRIDPGELSVDADDDARVGGALFRGRFATEPERYTRGDIAIALPFRVWDRYADLSDDPENSYVQLAWTRPGAIWKRVAWKQVPEEFTEVLALVRFSGGPAWDSTDVVRLGQEEIPRGDRSKHLYLINRPEDLNLLNVEADRIEVRLMVRFDRGAYDRTADERPNHWKNSPWIQRVRVESIAPALVIYQE